jgi:hypothetical protein
MDCIRLTQDRERWRALFKAMMNFYVSKMRGISCLTEKLLASPKEICSM